MEKKLEHIEQKEEQLNKRNKEIQKIKDDLVEINKQQIEQLEHVSGMSRDEAKDILLEKVENEVKHDMAVMIRDNEQKAKDEANKKARK